MNASGGRLREGNGIGKEERDIDTASMTITVSSRTTATAKDVEF